MSGFDNKRAHKATLLRSPPESWLIFASQGGRRRASAAMSKVCSKFQPSIASIASVRLPCLSIRAFISSSSKGSEKRLDTASNSFRRSVISLMPCSTLARTSKSSSSIGSCGRKPTLMSFWGRASPSISLSTPAMIRSSNDDLPEPFKPSTPIFAPGKNDREMFSRIVRLGGTVFETDCIV